MPQPAHTIKLESWPAASFGERLALEICSLLLWPLKPDERMTALLTLLAEATLDVAENEDQIDAIVDAMRVRLKQHLNFQR